MKLIDADKVKELIKGPLSVDTDADKEYVCGLIDKIGSGWISVKDRLPESQVQVLAVKQLKSGLRQIAIAYCIREYTYTDPVTQEKRVKPYWVCGGNNNVIWWMPMPEMPPEVEG